MPKDHWYVRTKTQDFSYEMDFREIGNYVMGINVYFASMQHEWLARFGTAAVEQIQKNIRAGGVGGHSLHPVTVALKGSRQPLVDKGNMLKTINWVIKGNSVEIGWNDPKASRAASIADNGATVQVSDAMRRLFAAVGYPLKKDTTVLVIKPRPITTNVQDQMHKSGAWDKVLTDASAAASRMTGSPEYL